MNSTQCKRKVCKKADNPSIKIRMARVKRAHAPKVMNNMIDPLTVSVCFRPIDRTMLHNTSESSGENEIK